MNNYESLRDNLVYLFLSSAFLWIALAWVILLLRNWMRRAQVLSFERWLYVSVIVGLTGVLTWNAIKPYPVLFDERVGLFWGIVTQNAAWKIDTGAEQGPPPVAHSGQTSMEIDFQKTGSWVIFQHVPMPQISRYEALEFYVLQHDLKQDSLWAALYSDGEVLQPPNALKLDTSLQCPGYSSTDGWDCYRIPISSFPLPAGNVIGVAVGKGDGVEQGSFYLDDMRLIEPAH